MASLLTVVPGSRRPIRVDSTGVVVNIAVQGPDRSSFSKAGTNSSASRRKPQTTYRSPSLQFPSDLCIEHSGQTIRSSPAGLGPPPALPGRCSHASSAASTNVPVRMKYPMKPPLPIYHPLGRLALSLPELDPGMRPQSSLSLADDAMRGAASRPRRPAARVRDAADADNGDTGTPLAVPVETPAPPEKPSPRKRRSGGQTNSRRRRREADDGDATYPAKRTRANRAPPVPASDSGSLGNGADAADADGTEEGVKAPERRSTRSRAAAQVKPPPIRRNSSASDKTQTSVSVSIAGGQPRKEDVDVTPAGATARSSASSGETEAAPVIQMAVDEPPTQGILTESQSSKPGADEPPPQTAAPSSGGLLTSGAPQKNPREECEPGEEGGLRLPS